MTKINCYHMCHDKDSGLNPWVEACPICHCINPKYVPGAKCCFSCFCFPCECGEHNYGDMLEKLIDVLIGKD